MDEQTRLRKMLGEAAASEPGLQHVVCQVDSYEQLLREKVARARQVLEEAGALGPPACTLPALEVHPSQPSHFRQRADLWIRSDTNEGLPGAVLYYAMAPATNVKEPTSNVAASSESVESLCPTLPGKGVRLNGFPVASLRVNGLMESLIVALNQAPPGSTLRSRLYEARFLTSLRGTGPSLITLIYHCRLDSAWEMAARQLAADLECSIVGRSRGQKVVIGQDWVDEELLLRNWAKDEDGSGRSSDAGADPLPPRSFYYRHAENGFSQPNAAVNERMLEFALSCCTSTRTSDCVGGEAFAFNDSDLLELYCGNANFTVPLSRKFRSVLATELAGPSVELAQHNLRTNGCTNATVVRASASEVAHALQVGQLEQMVKEAATTLPSHVLPQPSTLRTLLVDPPRSGLDATVVSIARRFFRYVIYISCNPTTMLRDIRALAEPLKTETNIAQVQPKVIRFATFDQFPYTTHLECAAMLELVPLPGKVAGGTRHCDAGRNSGRSLTVVEEPEPQLHLEPAAKISRDKRGRTTLHLAASKGLADTVFSLLTADTRPAFLDATDRDGCTALLRASEPGHLEVVKLLLGAGAATELADKWGRTVLHCAALKGRMSVASLLVNHGATDTYLLSNSLDKHRRTPLHYAAFSAQGSTEMLALLVSAKSNVELKDEYAQTPLDRAVSSGRAVAVVALVAAGADLCTVDKHGRTPLHCAASVRDRLSVVRALLRNSTAEDGSSGTPTVPTPMTVVDQRDRNGRTALFVAAAGGLVDVVALLIREGNADVNIPDNLGVSPLSAAAAKAAKSVVSVLLEAAAALDTQDTDGCTALHHAALHGHGEIVETLLAAGADSSILSSNGVSFMHISSDR